MEEKKTISIFIFKIIPQCFISRLFGSLTRIPFPRSFLNWIIEWYTRSFEIKTEEYITPEGGFKNFDMFFTRLLKKGVHKIDNSPKAIVSPVDARIDQYGKIEDRTLIQAKGLDYSLSDLVPSDSAQHFKDGHFMTLYLSPSDYHRIHSPVSGRITGYFNIPGRLFTVQEYMVKNLKNLFPRNERLISYVDSGSGMAGVCKVGALNVGRISISHGDIITNKTFRSRKEVLYPETERPEIAKGDELGIFHLGSTIILLFQKDMMTFDDIAIGTKVRMGERIGSLKA
ncbi:MAG: phosphatidylserine decarboxylase [bacterium]|nr:phosphatidylserine decarboxylase [bacterium]